MNLERKDWTLVVAVAANGVIGRGNSLPWKLSTDLRRFKQLTMGHCLLMGRKTFESIGRSLPGRQTIVLSRAGFECAAPNVAVVASIEQVAASIEPGKRLMVVGGAEVFRLSLPRCQHIWMTRVLADVAGDTYFPVVDWTRWRMVDHEEFPGTDKDEYATRFERWERL